MGQIERTFAIPSDASPVSVSESTPSIGANTSSIGSAIGRQPPQGEVGAVRQDLCFFARIARVQRLIEALQPVSDADLLQHARDLTQLMEQAWNVYLETRDEGALQKARRYMGQRDAARRLLSREWRDAREAEILAACGAAYFVDMGDKDRAQIAANEGKALA